MAADQDSVMDLVRQLCQRPRVGELPARKPGQRIWRRGLPMLCLVRPETIRDEVRGQIKRVLQDATPHRIPHALLELNPGRSYPPSAENDVLLPAKADDVKDVRAMLAALAAQLKRAANAGEGRIRFGRFGLIDWLMDQHHGTEEGRPRDPDQWLRDQLRAYDLQRVSTGTAVLDTVPVTGWVAATARLLLRFSPRLWSGLRRTGRIPLIGGKYRWFLRKQPYLTPRDPGSFLGFAERLTGDQYRLQDPEALLRLLVHAFLDDLRRAFGHRHWPWRLHGARRMAYIVAVLDGISRDNRGYRLLKLINDVRTETGQFDPLLIISTSQMVPPYAQAPDTKDDNPARRYAVWRKQFSDQSRAGKPNAWYLPLTVADPVSDRIQLAISRPPWWSSRGIAVALAILLGGLLGGPPLGAVVGWRNGHCGVGPSTASTLLRTEGSECVGVTDGSYLFQPGNADLSMVETTIRQQNAEATRDHQVEPERPYAQLVFLAALSSTTVPPDPLVSEREVLEGVAALQRRQLDNRGAADPIIRILIASAGTDMQHGKPVAQIIGSMAAADPSIVGVVGFDQSRRPVARMIRELNGVGLPMVAATLSADGMPHLSPLYFQVSPQNTREAEVAAAFAPKLLDASGKNSRQVRIVYPDDRSDIYALTLARDAVRRFRSAGFATQHTAFEPRNPVGVGETSCGFGGLIFYAGRPDTFPGFLSGINQRCRDAVPTILASDDVSRYVADARERTTYSSIPFYYVSLAVGSPTCGAGASSGEDVYHTIKSLFPFECGLSEQHDPSLDGHALLAYDATWALTVAVQDLSGAGVPLSPGAVWRELSTLRLDGQSGEISFGTGPEPQVPPDKTIAILRVAHGSVHETPYVCGRLPGGMRPYRSCPVDR